MKLNITDSKDRLSIVALDEKTGHEIIIDIQYTESNKYKLLHFFYDALIKCENEFLK